MAQDDTAAPRVTVVGGGIVGICTALYLAKAGVPTRLIERDAPGQGASHGNAGVIGPGCVLPNAMPGLLTALPGMVLNPRGPLRLRPGHLPGFIGFGLRFLANARPARVTRIAHAMAGLNHDNIGLYRALLAGTGAEELIRDSLFIHASRHESALRETPFEQQLQAELGVEVARISGEELHRLEPALHPDYKGALVMKGQGRSLSPGQLGTALAGKFQQAGGQIIRADVLRLFPVPEGWDIATSQGRFAAPKLVIAAGAWSAGLLAPLGVNLPLQAERGYHAFFPSTGQLVANSVMDQELKVVASAMEGGTRLAGTAEYSGLDHPPSARRQALVAAHGRMMLPALADSPAQGWSGQRPTLPDSLPVLGPIPGHSGLYGNFGHSHWGLMMAPRSGMIMADLVQGKPVNTDLAPFRADRF